MPFSFDDGSPATWHSWSGSSVVVLLEGVVDLTETVVVLAVDVVVYNVVGDGAVVDVTVDVSTPSKVFVLHSAPK